jgi:formate dehydrogenase major subunit
MTYRVKGIKQKIPDNWVEISPELAAERKIESGRWVELTSRYGQVKVRALVTDRVRGHELYMPMNSGIESSEHAVNRLTSSFTDRATHTPAHKETPVKMRLLSELGENPLPRSNFRFGSPTPQRGVEVERKWKRPNYYLPGTRNGERDETK